MQIRIKDDAYKKLTECAQAEKRSRANMLDIIINNYMRNYRTDHSKVSQDDNGPQPEDWVSKKGFAVPTKNPRTVNEVEIKDPDLFLDATKGTAVTTQVPSYGSPGSMHANKAQQADSKAKMCKVHGTPLTEKGKCLQKGCKYA